MAKTAEAAIAANRQKAMDKFLDSDATYAASEFAGRLMNAGYSGVIKSLEFKDLTGANITPRTADQLVGGIVVANNGEATALPTLVFEDGRELALAGLVSHPESKINSTPCFKITGKDWKAMIGKTLVCEDRFADEEKASTRTIPGQAPRRSIPQRYTLTVA